MRSLPRRRPQSKPNRARRRPRPTFGPDRVHIPPIDPATDLPAGPVISSATVIQWNELVDLARGLIAEGRDLDPHDADGVLDNTRMLDRVLDRVRAVDLDIAAELEMERDDPDAGRPADWPAWTDADVWEPNEGLVDPADADEDLEPAPLLTLADWIEAQARRYQDLATDAGAMLGQSLLELASLVRLTGATTPATALARLAALDAAALADRWSSSCN
jgi:hypothetical protein